ncbi:MAG: glutathione-independent formaldehyde dehydrogenase [Labilithrix sp.]|nr:glutathione-independent formaldehyde dehydrogenase [Labilithrix sp.]
MRAVVLKGTREVAVERVPDPEIEAPTDAIIRVTSAAICGSDLHMFAGRTVAPAGLVLGHEPLGVVEEVGADVTSVRRGDRVVVPFNVSCGVCFNCARGFTSACLAVTADSAGGAYGYVGMGPYRGAQAEYLRVPFAETNCLKVPGKAGDEWEDAFVLLADVFPTGWYANELAGVDEGSTVAVFGAGPVGLLAAYSALLKDAGEVYIVDGVDDRLAKAAEIGACPIDFRQGDPVEQIVAQRRRRTAGKLRPGEEKMMGVMCGIEAVGYQAIDWSDPTMAENPGRVLEDLIRLVNPTGRIGSVGLYVPNDPGGINPHAKRGEFRLSFGKLWEKGLSLGTGQTPVVRFAPTLRDLIVLGKAKPDFLVSHRLPLEEAQDAYAKFEQRAAGYTKVILRPGPRVSG